LVVATCDIGVISATEVESTVRKTGVDTQVLALSPATIAYLTRNVRAVRKITVLEEARLTPPETKGYVRE